MIIFFFKTQKKTDSNESVFSIFRLEKSVPGVNLFSLLFLLVKPVLSYTLALCEETVSVLAEAVEVAEEGLLVS